MSQGGTVVLEKLVPELVLPPAVMDQRTAGKDNQAEQLIAVAGSALPTARDGQEMIKLVQVADAKIDIPINYVKLMCSVFAKLISRIIGATVYKKEIPFVLYFSPYRLVSKLFT